MKTLTIPKIEALAPGDAAYGKRLFDDLCDDYPLEADPARTERLVIIFDVAEMATSLAIMSATQGMIAIGGQGWIKWAYVELADLDALDREYSTQEEREAVMIATILMERANYSPEAMRTFWQRVHQDEDLNQKAKRLRRDLSPKERTQILEEVLPQGPTATEVNLPNDMQTSQRDFNAVLHTIQ